MVPLVACFSMQMHLAHACHKIYFFWNLVPCKWRCWGCVATQLRCTNSLCCMHSANCNLLFLLPFLLLAFCNLQVSLLAINAHVEQQNQAHLVAALLDFIQANAPGGQWPTVHVAAAMLMSQAGGGSGECVCASLL